MVLNGMYWPDSQPSVPPKPRSGVPTRSWWRSAPPRAAGEFPRFRCRPDRRSTRRSGRRDARRSEGGIVREMPSSKSGPKSREYRVVITPGIGHAGNGGPAQCLLRNDAGLEPGTGTAEAGVGVPRHLALRRRRPVAHPLVERDEERTKGGVGADALRELLAHPLSMMSPTPCDRPDIR